MINIKFLKNSLQMVPLNFSHKRSTTSSKAPKKKDSRFKEFKLALIQVNIKLIALPKSLPCYPEIPAQISTRCDGPSHPIETLKVTLWCTTKTHAHWIADSITERSVSVSKWVCRPPSHTAHLMQYLPLHHRTKLYTLQATIMSLKAMWSLSCS